MASRCKYCEAVADKSGEIQHADGCYADPGWSPGAEAPAAPLDSGAPLTPTGMAGIKIPRWQPPANANQFHPGGAISPPSLGAPLTPVGTPVGFRAPECDLFVLNTAEWLFAGIPSTMAHAVRVRVGVAQGPAWYIDTALALLEEIGREEGFTPQVKTRAEYLADWHTARQAVGIRRMLYVPTKP